MSSASPYNSFMYHTNADQTSSYLDIHVTAPRSFDWAQAQKLLPLVRRITGQAAQELEPIQTRINNMVPADPRLPELIEKYRLIVPCWQGKMQRLGVSAQGLRQLGFDIGEAWWSWQYPEWGLKYEQDYEQTFSKRRLMTLQSRRKTARVL